jgi:hypothetical protein
VQGTGAQLLRLYVDLIVFHLYDIDDIRCSASRGPPIIHPTTHPVFQERGLLSEDPSGVRMPWLRSHQEAARSNVLALHNDTALVGNLAPRPHAAILRNKRETIKRWFEQARQTWEVTPPKVPFMASQYSGCRKVQPLCRLLAEASRPTDVRA